MAGNFLSSVNVFSGIGTAEMVGLDISGSTLKICCLKVIGNKKELIFVASRPIAGVSDSDIAHMILNAVRELKLKKPTVVLFVPSQLVITKNIEVPSVDPKEIREIINLQAGRHTPYSREEVIVDYIPIGTFKQSYTKVLLLIVASNAVKRQFVIMDKAGIRVSRALLAQEGVAAFIARTSKTDPGFPVALVHIDEAATDFSIIANNKIIFLRSIPIGKQQLTTELEKALGKFAEEIKKSLEAYQTENIDKIPALILLMGSLAGLDALEAILNEAVQIPVRSVDYTSAIAKTPAAAQALASAADVSFLGILAGLQMYQECKTNFIPDEVKARFLLAERGRELLKTAVAVFSLVTLAFLFMVTATYCKGAYVKALEVKYKSSQEEARTLEAILKRNSLVRQCLASRGNSVKVLSELHALTPLAIQLNFIRFETDGKFVIRGTADYLSTALLFVDSLGKSKFFKEVKLKNSAKRLEGKREVADFEINCAIARVSE